MWPNGAAFCGRPWVQIPLCPSFASPSSALTKLITPVALLWSRLKSRLLHHHHRFFFDNRSIQDLTGSIRRCSFLHSSAWSCNEARPRIAFVRIDANNIKTLVFDCGFGMPKSGHPASHQGPFEKAVKTQINGKYDGRACALQPMPLAQIITHTHTIQSVNCRGPDRSGANRDLDQLFSNRPCRSCLLGSNFLMLLFGKGRFQVAFLGPDVVPKWAQALFEMSI